MAESTNVDSCRAEMERILNDVAEKISTGWKKLARRLEVPSYLIENIDADFQNIEEKAYQALMKWFQIYGDTDHNKTKHVLIKALRIESKLIADKICLRHNIKVPPAECTKLHEKPRVTGSAILLRNRESSKEMQQKSITDENKTWKTNPNTDKMREKRAQSETQNRTKTLEDMPLPRSLTSPAALMQPNITINTTYNINARKVTIVHQPIMS